MKSTKLYLIHSIVPACAALAALAPWSAQALTINGTQAPIVGGFHYEFTINTTTEPVEIAIITLDGPVNDALIGPSLTVPPGFLGNYDDNLGFIDFIGDTSFFSPGLIQGGFSFDSAGAPPEYFSTFTALGVDGDIVTGAINFQQQNVPDSGSSLKSACLGLLALAWVKQKHLRTLTTLQTRTTNQVHL